MDYSRPELADRLAAEYVLGTLRGPARRRLRSLLPAHPTLRRAVTHWRMRLMPLSVSVPAVEPGPAAWAGIERRLFGASSSQARAEPAADTGADVRADSRGTAHGPDTHPGGPASSSFGPTSLLTDSSELASASAAATTAGAARPGEVPMPRRRSTDRQIGDGGATVVQGQKVVAGHAGLHLWQGLTVFTSLGLLVLAMLLLQPAPVLAPLVIVLQANHESSAALPQPASFVASVSGDDRVLVLQPLDGVSINPSQALELWALPPGGMGSPRSLGMVASREPTTVTGERLLGDKVGLAVSLEPAGGSSTGQPSGPIVSIGKLSS
ncbi:MAG: hypothetical protein RIQ60_1618 [Pseudomonadota bacterium]|jgi:anti-sigma-K factor RskA